MLKGVHVHVNAVSSINMYGNAWGEVVNKTWGQVTVALLYSLWMLISQATLLSGCDCGDLTISCSNVTAIGGYVGVICTVFLVKNSIKSRIT